MFVAIFTNETNANEVACQLIRLGNYWYEMVTSEYQGPIACVFPENTTISNSNTSLRNAKDERVLKLRLNFDTNIDYLPINIVEVFPNLTETQSISSSLKFLTYSGLQKSYNLKSLNLRKGRIESFELNAFHDLNKLESLILTNNNIKDLPSQLFSSLKELEEIYLDENKLTRLDSKLFENIKNLKTLHLNKNQLTVIEPGTFASLSKVEEIILSNNQFKSIDLNEFKNNKTVKAIVLDDCKIEVIQNIEVIDVLLNTLYLGLFHNNCIDEFYIGGDDERNSDIKQAVHNCTSSSSDSNDDMKSY